MMACTQCGRQRPMSQIRFERDGNVAGTQTPRHHAVCTKCILAAREAPQREVVGDGDPF